jgi:vrille protein
MSSSPSVINDHPYHDTSSSCSSLENSEEKEDILLNHQSSRIKKDPIYCSQRSRNNLSAKRSRVKKRMNDLVLETKLTQLTNENEILRAKIEILRKKFDQENQQLFKATEQSPVLNILDQSSIQTTQTPATEQSSVNKSSIPIKLRFKLLNITSDS